MRLNVRRGSVLRIALLLGLIVEVLLPSGALLAAAPAAPVVAQRRAPSAHHALARLPRLAQRPVPRDAAVTPLASAPAASVVVPPSAHHGHDAAADSPRHAHGASPRDTAGSPPPSADATLSAGTPAAAASTPLPLPQAHHHPHPLMASNAGAVGETITVPFTDGDTGVSTAQSYLGPVTITVSGVGQADSSNYSDAFYVYQDGQGNPITPPEHFGPPGYFYTWMLWINGGPSDVYVPHYPAYNPTHAYVFTIVAPGGPLNFAVGDTEVNDNTGAYTVTVTRPTGTIPWHPHHTVRVSDHLSASVDLADGHVDVSASDLSIPGRGPDLTVNHIWDSALAEDALTSTAGQGWVSTLTPSMSGVLTQTVFFQDQSGATWPFSYTGALAATEPYTSYLTPAGLPWQLSTSSAGYTLTNILSSAVMTFTAQGAYGANLDAYSNSNTLNYGPSGPISEANSGGRTLALTYSNGLLSEVASPLWQASGGTQGQHVTYGYSGSQLTTQTLGAGTTDALTTTFGYSGTQLVSVTTPYTQATHTWTINYDPYGRVSSIVSPISGTAGQAGYTPALTTSFSYSPGQTQVIEGAGSSAPLTTTYTLDASGEPITVTDGLGDATGYTYDADHDVLTSRDADGNTTTNYYQYVGPAGSGGLGSTGLVTETDTPPIAAYVFDNGLTPGITLHRYDPISNDLLETDLPEGGVTQYAYDGHHSVITTTQLLQVIPNSSCPQSPIRHKDAQTASAAQTQRPDTGGQCMYNFVWRGSLNQYDPYGEQIAVTDGRAFTVTSPPNTTGAAQQAVTTVTLGTCAPGDTCPISYTHSYTYTAQGDLAQQSTPPIVTSLNGVTTTAPVTASYSYNADGNRLSLISANNFGTSTATTYGYDHLGRPITTTLPPVPLYTGVTAAPVMTTSYDGEGNVVRQVDANGDVTLSSYDPLGRLLASVNPVGGTTLYTDTATEQVAQQDPQGNVTTYAYDAAGRQILTSDPLTNTVQTQYDFAGNPLTITTGTPSTTTQVESRQYDALDRVITDTISAPGSPPSTTLTAYDHDGNVAQTQTAQGDVTFNTYDLADQLHTVEVDAAPVGAASDTGQPVNATYQLYRYDNAGNTVERIDFDNRDEQTTYDGDNRAVGSTDSYTGTGTMTTTSGYDPDGNLVSQVVTTTSPVAATRSYTAAVNAADWTSSSSDQPTASTAPLVTAYSYDAAGQQRGQTILNSSPPVTSTLDAEGRTTAIGEGVTTSSPYTTTYGYNPDDLPVTATLPNGVQEGLGYDQDSRLITTTAIGPTGVVTPLNNSYAYAYNPSSWTTAITTVVSGITATNVITHDALGRMVAGNASGRAQSWRYDGNGNLLSTNTVTYSYTAAITPNEVLTTTSTAGVTTTYSYDQNGDTTGISSTSGVSTNLSYDSQARLDAVKLADGTLILMTYNAQGQRVGYSVSKNGLTSEAEQVTYRGDELAQAVISTTQRYTDTYLYDPTGAPLELIRQTKNGSTLSTARYWYVLNGHGDVVALTDVSGTVVDSYSYDLWGRLGSAVESVPQRLRYAGYWYDQELGWYWVAVRSYNPTLMRWLQPDPSQQDGVRTYVYVGDDPVDGTDSNGLCGPTCAVAPVVCLFTWEIPVVDLGTCGTALVVGVVGVATTAGVVYVATHHSSTRARAVPQANTATRTQTRNRDRNRPDYVVRCGQASPTNLVEAYQEHVAVPGVYGFSVQFAPGRGLSVEDLGAAAACPNSMLSFATVPQLEAAASSQGYIVVLTPTPGRGYHFTLSVIRIPKAWPEETLPINVAEALSSAFERMPNPGRR